MTIFIILLIGFFLVWGWQSLKNKAKYQEEKEKKKIAPKTQLEVIEKWNEYLENRMNVVSPNVRLAHYIRDLRIEFCLPYKSGYTREIGFGGYDDDCYFEKSTKYKEVQSPLGSDYIEDTEKIIQSEEEDLDQVRLSDYRIIFEYLCIKNGYITQSEWRDATLSCGWKSFGEVYSYNKIYAACNYFSELENNNKTEEINNILGLQLEDDSVCTGHNWFLKRYDELVTLTPGCYTGPFRTKKYALSYPTGVHGLFPSVLSGLSDKSFLEKLDCFLDGRTNPIPANTPIRIYQKNRTLWERFHETRQAYILFSETVYMLVKKEMYDLYGVRTLVPIDKAKISVEQDKIRNAAEDSIENNKKKYPWYYE